MTNKFFFRAIWHILSISHMRPATCIGTIALVEAVVAASIFSGSRLKSRPTSTKIGFAPVMEIAFVVMIQV